MESGASVTIADAMKYLSMDMKIAPTADPEDENVDDALSDEEENPEPKPILDDDPNLPKVSFLIQIMINETLTNHPLQSMCQECLEKLQSAYEFKFRCEENRQFLSNYLKECADSKLAEERAVKQAAMAALDLDIDNLDNLPDKLVLKTIIKEKKPRKPRDPSKPPIVRRRRIPEKNIIIAEDSQVESPAYVRKMVTTPEQSPDQARASKRKSKHVIIEDIFVGEKNSKKTDPKSNKQKSSNTKENVKIHADVPDEVLPLSENEVKTAYLDDEPTFPDDIEFEDEPTPKRGKRSKK